MTLSKAMAFRLNFSLVVLGILIVVGGGSLGLVSLRMEIEKTAQEIQSMESELSDLERFARFLDARIAHTQQPKELKKLVAERGLPLQAPSPDQFVHIHGPNHELLSNERALVADRRQSGKKGNTPAFSHLLSKN